MKKKTYIPIEMSIYHMQVANNLLAVSGDNVTLDTTVEIDPDQALGRENDFEF